MSTIATTCHLCGHEWAYGGSKAHDELVTCPKCNSHTPAGEGARTGPDRSGGIDAECDKCGHTWNYHGQQEVGGRTTCPSCRRNTRL